MQFSEIIYHQILFYYFIQGALVFEIGNLIHLVLFHIYNFYVVYFIYQMLCEFFLILKVKHSTFAYVTITSVLLNLYLGLVSMIFKNLCHCKMPSLQ